MGSFNVGYYYHAPNNAMQATYVTQNGVSKSSYPTYNYAGHMTWDGTNQFAFNALDQLISSTNASSATQYGYDGLGMRIWSQKGSAAKVYEFHSRDNRILMEWQASSGGTPGFTKEHIYAGQRRIAEVHTISGQAAKITHAHPDPSGSPAMLSDASGLVSAREHYRPYGDKLISPNTNESAGFANKAFDASTNLSYMSARYYNPTLGRFISPDPVHFVEDNVHSFNRYAYANNNPMRFVDPDGKSAVHAVAFGLGFAIDVAAQTAVGMAGGKSFGTALGEVSLQSAALSGLAAAATGNVAAGLAGKALDGSMKAGAAISQTAAASAVANGGASFVDSKLDGENIGTAATKAGFSAAGGLVGGAIGGGRIGNKGASHLDGLSSKGGIHNGMERTTRDTMVPGRTSARTGSLGVAGQITADTVTSTGSKAAEKAVD
jgi:RHS repeat-associated protein